MSGLARMMQAAGAVCRGSDKELSEITSDLLARGIPVSPEGTGVELPEPCDLVIASAAIRSDHPVVQAARRGDVPVMTYAEALGAMQASRTGVSIAGTHGKSTTTAVLAHVLIECGLDPGFIVGATCAQIGGGSRTGASVVPGDGPLAGLPGLLLAEACEFNRSFHHHRPRLALINNVEADHLDVYGSLEAVIEAFAHFARLVPDASAGGRLLIAHDGAHRREVTAGVRAEVSTFGFNPAADYHVLYEQLYNRVSVVHEDRELGRWTLPMAGEHNALNTAAAAILASWCGADWAGIGPAIASFQGVERRMQLLGIRSVVGGDVPVYDDYGHHPTEVDSTLRALKQREKPQRLICVFQPHQHSRTRFLLDEFAASFSHADVVIVPPIYFVRDSEIEKSKVSAGDLVDRLRQRGVQACHLHPFEAIVEHLETIVRPGDLVVIMGAGPVWRIGRMFLGRE